MEDVVGGLGNLTIRGSDVDLGVTTIGSMQWDTLASCSSGSWDPRNSSFRAIPSVYRIILLVFTMTKAVTAWKETEDFTEVKLLFVNQVLYFPMC